MSGYTQEHTSGQEKTQIYFLTIKEQFTYRSRALLAFLSLDKDQTDFAVVDLFTSPPEPKV